ncbi:LysR substrate-binding domain-containing protein [Mesorhizobium sp. M0968]
MPLFFRHGRGLTLTEAGKIFLQRGRAALSEMEEAFEAIAELKVSPSGTVHVGLPPSVAKLAMANLARRFRAEFPAASLKVIEMYTGDVPEQLATGRIDIGIFYESQVAATVCSEAIFVEDLYLVGGPESLFFKDAKCPFDILQEIPLILPARQHGVRSLLDREATRSNRLLHPILELDAMSPLLELVRQGIGYTVLPIASVHDLVADNVVKASMIVNPVLTRKVFIGVSRERPFSSACRAALRLVRQTLDDSATKACWRSASELAWQPAPGNSL